jgi:histidinol-phosphate aminotransferase
MEQIVGRPEAPGLHAHSFARQLRDLPGGRRGAGEPEAAQAGRHRSPDRAYGMPDWLRVTIGTESENARFLAALEGSL